MHRLLAPLIVITLLASGCATVKQPQSKNSALTESIYYQLVRDAQSKGMHAQALKYINELNGNFPKNPYRELLLLESAYAYYQVKAYPQAIDAAQKFKRQAPKHSSLDYAHYLVALAQNKMVSIDSQRETEHLRAAFSEFDQIARRFPKSQYHQEAIKQQEEILNRLAELELEQIKALIAKGDTQKALERTNYLKKSYPNTPAAKQAFDVISGAHTTLIGSSEVTLGTRWIESQNPEHFTIQLLGNRNLENLHAFVEKYRLQSKAHIFQSNHLGDKWYTLFYDTFPSQREAHESINRLESLLPIQDAWVRQFKQIQETIRGTADQRQ